MLSAVILAFDAEEAAARRDEAVARALSSLVPACVAGVIGDALIAGPAKASLRKVADEAGCALIEAEDARLCLERALRAARRPETLLLMAGYAVESGFVDEIRDMFAFGETGARALRAAPHSLLTRLAPRLARPVGLIARKDDCAGADSLARLARRLRARDLATRARKAT